MTDKTKQRAWMALMAEAADALEEEVAYSGALEGEHPVIDRHRKIAERLRRVVDNSKRAVAERSPK